MCSRHDAGGEPTCTIWCSSTFPERPAAGTSSASTCAAPLLRKRSPFLWAAPSTSLLRRILTTLQNPMRMLFTGRWSQHFSLRLRRIHRSAGESSKPAGKSRASARSVKLVRALFAKPPDLPGGRKRSNSTPRLKPPNHSPHLQPNQSKPYLQPNQREKSSYEES